MFRELVLKVLLGGGLLLSLFFPTIACGEGVGKHRKKYETRAVWLTTIHGLDWPSRKASCIADETAQKRELTLLLDRLERAHINTIYFQVRGRGDLIYHSKIEPIMESMVRHPFYRLKYDPMAFLLEEAHRRGMRVHAWIVALPLGTPAYTKKLSSTSYLSRHRSECILYNGQWYMDPANSQTDLHLSNIVRELLSRYEVDGIHLDYIRYPDEPSHFPDTQRGGNLRGGTANALSEVRKNNIDRIVRSISEVCKEIRGESIEVSVAAIGRYRRLPASNKGAWTALESVYQDPIKWGKEGLVDHIAPMMYQRGNSFTPYLKDWIKLSQVPIIVGLGAYWIYERQGGWPTSTILEQIRQVQNEKEVSGVALFRASHIRGGLLTALEKEYFSSPTLPKRGTLNPLQTDWSPPIEIALEKSPRGLLLQWNHPQKNSTPTLFSVHTSYEDQEIDPRDPKTLLGITKSYSFEIPMPTGNEERLLRVLVTAYRLKDGVEMSSMEHVFHYLP